MLIFKNITMIAIIIFALILCLIGLISNTYVLLKSNDESEKINRFLFILFLIICIGMNMASLQNFI